MDHVGEIKMFGSVNLPSNFIPCLGGTYSKDLYSELYGDIGTSWNTGSEPAGTFRVPNFPGKAPVGPDPADPNLATVGKYYGTKAATMPTHTPTLTGAPGKGSLVGDSHTHPGGNNTVRASPGAGNAIAVSDNSAAPTGPSTVPISGAPDIGSLAVNPVVGSGDNMPPSAVVMFGICFRQTQEELAALATTG